MHFAPDGETETIWAFRAINITRLTALGTRLRASYNAFTNR